MTSIYLIGSLRNEAVPKLANAIREATGAEVFDCWYAAGPEADDYWQKYATQRNQSYEEALRDYPAQHVFQYDKRHLTRCDAAVLVLPTGKSGHMEFGWFMGRREAVGLPVNGFIYAPEDVGRYDVMYAFSTRVCTTESDLINNLNRL